MCPGTAVGGVRGEIPVRRHTAQSSTRTYLAWYSWYRRRCGWQTHTGKPARTEVFSQLAGCTTPRDPQHQHHHGVFHTRNKNLGVGNAGYAAGIRRAPHQGPMTRKCGVECADQRLITTPSERYPPPAMRFPVPRRSRMSEFSEGGVAGPAAVGSRPLPLPILARVSRCNPNLTATPPCDQCQEFTRFSSHCSQEQVGRELQRLLSAVIHGIQA